MYNTSIYGIIRKKSPIRIDIMKKNAIISLAMLYALWQAKRGDLLDLIRPFVVYAIGKTTNVGDAVDIDGICRYMESEFGYQSFQSAVIVRILRRETSEAIKQDNRIIQKRNHQFILIAPLSKQIEMFASKRSVCKEHSDAVTKALADYLSQNCAYKRGNYTTSEAEEFLLSFFERQGGSIVLSTDNLHQLSYKSSEIDFFIGKFILEQEEKKSLLMDYIVELVKGYFVTTALYLQAENPDVTRASFSNVTFYLDTRLLLAFLGFKTAQENNSVQTMVNSLQSHGAKIACFDYNIGEVESILEAYKQAIVSPHKRPSTITLEFFDEYGASYTHVDAAQKMFPRKLRSAGIDSISFEKAKADNGVMEKISGLLNAEEFRSILLQMKPSYNTSSLPDDAEAINTVSRIRQGKRLPNIEKCKAVFVTSNPLLVAATKQLLKQNQIDLGFPLAITGNDLCVIAWLKDFEQNNNLPKMRLLENVLAAITPTKELMDFYFENLDYLEKQGEITEEEAALLRVDQFAKKELMELTKGENENLNTAVINTIREKIKAESRNEGIKIGEQKSKQVLNHFRNQACKKAEAEVESEFCKKEARWLCAAKIVSVILALALAASSVYLITNQGLDSIAGWLSAVATVITAIQAILPFFSKDTWIIRFIRRWLQHRKLRELDRRKAHYLNLFVESSNSDNLFEP